MSQLVVGRLRIDAECDQIPEGIPAIIAAVAQRFVGPRAPVPSAPKFPPRQSPDLVKCGAVEEVIAEIHYQLFGVQPRRGGWGLRKRFGGINLLPVLCRPETSLLPHAYPCKGHHFLTMRARLS